MSHLGSVSAMPAPLAHHKGSTHHAHRLSRHRGRAPRTAPALLHPGAVLPHPPVPDQRHAGPGAPLRARPRNLVRGGPRPPHRGGDDPQRLRAGRACLRGRPGPRPDLGRVAMASRILVRTKNGSDRYAIDGREAVRVTSVLDALAKHALYWWNANEAAKWAADNMEALSVLGRDDFVDAATAAPRKIRNAAAAKGTDLHGWAETLSTGGYVDVPEDQQARVNHVLDFLDRWHVEPVMTERTVFHDRFGYAGTLDVVADLRDGNRWLLDYKTGKGVYQETALQLAAYRFAPHMQVAPDRDEPMVAVDRVGVVHVTDDGW